MKTKRVIVIGDFPIFHSRISSTEKKFQDKAWELLAEEVKKGNKELLTKIEKHLLK